MAIARSTAMGFRSERLLRHFALGEAGVIAALFTIALLFWLLEPVFLSECNVLAMFNLVSFIGIIAIGQIILLISGEFDLSAGSVAGFAAVVSGRLMTAVGWLVPAAPLGGLPSDRAFGLIDGLSAIGLRIPAVIQTLGMLSLGHGLTQLATGGYPACKGGPTRSKLRGRGHRVESCLLPSGHGDCGPSATLLRDQSQYIGWAATRWSPTSMPISRAGTGSQHSSTVRRPTHSWACLSSLI